MGQNKQYPFHIQTILKWNFIFSLFTHSQKGNVRLYEKSNYSYKKNIFQSAYYGQCVKVHVEMQNVISFVIMKVTALHFFVL